MAAEARVLAPFTATGKQAELARHWRDPAVRVVCVGGAIRSGKSQAAARLLVETAVERPSTYLICRSTYRELEDSTKKIVLHGDGNVPPAIPPELIDQYRASDNVVRLKTGSEILFRSLEEQNVGKLLNITAGAFLIDQAEELSDGDDGERIYDTLLGRLSDPSGPRKALLVCNPAGLTHWVHRRLVADETRDPDTRYAHVVLMDNAANLPPDYVHAMLQTRETRPAWFRSFILGEWGAFEGQAFPEFEDEIHVVRPFPIPEHWERFESLDHGANHPTHWLVWTSDEDGNHIIASEYASPGLVSKHAAEILERRKRWKTERCWADPSVFSHHGMEVPRKGVPASIATEYAQSGIYLIRANNDRAAGYARILELLHVEEGRIAPPWAQIRDGVNGAPRLYIISTCRELIRQLKSAPVAVDGQDAAEAVDRKWEGAHGHGVASLRYGAMTRPSPSAGLPTPQPDDPRAARIRERLKRIEEREARDLIDV